MCTMLRVLNAQVASRTPDWLCTQRTTLGSPVLLFSTIQYMLYSPTSKLHEDLQLKPKLYDGPHHGQAATAAAIHDPVCSAA
jgi:hypothetical protein